MTKIKKKKKKKWIVWRVEDQRNSVSGQTVELLIKNLICGQNVGFIICQNQKALIHLTF